MEKNTTKVTVNIKDCSPIEEVHYLKIALPALQGLNTSLGKDLSVQYETSLSTGLVSRIENSLEYMNDFLTRILRIYKLKEYTCPFVALFIKFVPTSNIELVSVKSTPSSKFTDATTGAELRGFPLEVFTAESDPFYTTTPSMGAEYLQFEYRPDSNTWPDQACVLNFEIPVTLKKLPRFEEEPQVLLKEEESLGKLDTTSLFNSKVFSDVVVECGSRIYPAHRVVLAGNSPVFQAMLTHPTEEARKGQIIIEDVDPAVLEALLRFIYTGKVDPLVLEERGDDLYRAADKYDVKDLLLYCEAHLLKNLQPENALVVYDLAQCRPSSALAKRCHEIIARNRDSIADNADSFKNFTIKYPDLIFEIFRKS